MSTRDLDPALLPWSVEAESSVLGGLLQENAAWDRVADLLDAKHFYDFRHGLIYGAVAGLVLANRPADVVTVFNELEKAGKAEEVGGLPYLNSLAQYVPSASNIRRYAEIVVERALMRGMLEAADKAKEIATATSGPGVPERLNEVMGLFQALQVHRGRKMPRHISEPAAGLLARVDELAQGRRAAGLPTRIPGLDKLLGGGLKAGKQIVLAARPSVGKTSLALAIGVYLALDGHGVGILSQEMEAEELTDRAAANLGEVSLEGIITGKLDGESWSRLTKVAEDLKTLPLYVDDQPALTLADIQAKARMLKRQHDIKLLVVDYIQLCAGNPKADRRSQQLEEISRGTKVLAKQLGITIVLLSQLGREVEKRMSGRPVLSDLKESGALEEDADVVGLLSVSFKRSGGVNVIELDLAKNRQGRKGSVFLAFDGEHQRWTETIISDKPVKSATRHYTEDV